MSEISSGTVLITGPTGGLGRPAAMAMANRPEGERPDLLLVGRPGQALHDASSDPEPELLVAYRQALWQSES
ncbi:MAG: hypothetical protein ACLP8X_21160 [Streptosporangiaceae bacterium]|jgi:short-subunit dehydrogenase